MLKLVKGWDEMRVWSDPGTCTHLDDTWMKLIKVWDEMEEFGSHI